MTTRLRYTGELVQTFSTGMVGTVEPQGEFDVSDELADRFLVRRDIELVSGPPKTPRTPKQPRDAGAGDPDAGADASETSTGDPADGNDTGQAGDPATLV